MQSHLFIITDRKVVLLEFIKVFYVSILLKFELYHNIRSYYQPPIPNPFNSPMRIFIAGIMQGSHAKAAIHDQDYRVQIDSLLKEAFPEADIYDPRANHKNSLEYKELTGREVFFRHNFMCREVDVLLAFLPEASMGTAIEMWEAYQHGATVISISPLKHNWAVKFLSHILYADIAEFAAAIGDGSLRRKVEDLHKNGQGSGFGVQNSEGKSNSE
jgi:hypothetical protein